MNEESVTAVIRAKFDLGYIVELENGIEAQLRVLEQRGRELELHVAGLEEKIYGERIAVYITHQDKNICTVSQFTTKEREQRNQDTERRKQAADNCSIGDTFNMKITQDYEWGYLCVQDGGYLVGAIKKPTADLRIEERVITVVVGKSSYGEPVMELANVDKNA